jgi:acyl carrier protein
MPTPDEVIESIFSALRTQNFYLDESGPDSKFGPAGIDLDSLSVIWLASHIEATYGVVLTEEDMEALAVTTVGEFAAEVIRRSQPAVQADAAPR